MMVFEDLPVLDMSYYAAKLPRVLHLHVLHVLHFLLAYRCHGIRLRQTDQCCVVEHPSDNSGSFDQPDTMSIALTRFGTSLFTRPLETEILIVVDMAVIAPKVASSEEHCHPKRRTSPSISSILHIGFGFVCDPVEDRKTIVSSGPGSSLPYPRSTIFCMSRSPRVQNLLVSRNPYRGPNRWDSTQPAN